MNTSNITQTIGIGLLRRSMAGALLATAITATAVGLAATSHADPAPAPNFAGAAICKTDPWGFLGSQRRTLCDGPISSDGSWTRERTIWVPAHQTMYNCYGGSDRSYSRTCSGGYWTNERLLSNETYPVRPETVLPDEPGHLG